MFLNPCIYRSTVFNCFQLGGIFWDLFQCFFDPPRVGQSHYPHMLNQQVKLGLVVTQQPGDVHRANQHNGSHTQPATACCQSLIHKPD